MLHPFNGHTCIITVHRSEAPHALAPGPETSRARSSSVASRRKGSEEPPGIGSPEPLPLPPPRPLPRPLLLLPQLLPLSRPLLLLPRPLLLPVALHGAMPWRHRHAVTAHELRPALSTGNECGPTCNTPQPLACRQRPRGNAGRPRRQARGAAPHGCATTCIACYCLASWRVALRLSTAEPSPPACALLAQASRGSAARPRRTHSGGCAADALGRPSLRSSAG